MKMLITIIALLLFYTLVPGQQLRPPSVPLVTHDPYFSIWSPADKLTDRTTTHWTGKNQSLHSIIRIDGISYRLMGIVPSNLEPMKQKNVTVLPTRTIYEFGNKQVNLVLTFLTPALPSDLDLLSRPITYITWQVKAVDGKQHDIQLYFDCCSELAVNETSQMVNLETIAIPGLKTARIGTVEQPVLQKYGDNIRIDWGYAFLSAAENGNAQNAIGNQSKLQKEFVQKGKLAPGEQKISSVKVSEGWPSMALSFDAGKIESKGCSFTAMLGYDDLLSIRYFDEMLPAWWKREGMTFEKLLQTANSEYEKVDKASSLFEGELMKDLENAGGKKYASMCALVYRQCLAAHKLVADKNGMPLIFSKENFSNGCIATVDVIYPASPFFLLLSPALTKAMLQPNLDYAASPKWKFPFAPHDIGTYPFAVGQAYGGGEETEDNQMPIEETGNMILMTAALARIEGNADYAKAHWPVIEKWCEYLLSKGFDPENQLCTDDFAGHLAHNINLSAKAIEAIGAYALLCDMTGKKEKAAEIRKKAEIMAKEWVKQAVEGDHTRLAYDRPGTWSQKYNLVWDKVLDLNLFPNEVIQNEIKYYKTRQAEFGLPLDSRERYTKNDWITWTATMADTKEDFQELFNPVYNFADKTPSRVPLSDWYNTDNAYQIGFQARSVVGGFFIKILKEKSTWKKWASLGTNVKGTWASLKFAPALKQILQTAKEKSAEWKYTFDNPPQNWFKTDFNDSYWKTGNSFFGSNTYHNTVTVWASEDIWMRRTFEISELSDKNLALLVLHDDDAEIYINDFLAASLDGANGRYDTIKLMKKIKDILHLGANTIAVHCKNTGGEQYIDAGLAEY